MSYTKEQFMARVQVEPLGCWLWRGLIIRQGYGVVPSGRKSGTKPMAHRISYEMHVGPIPTGLMIDHLCRNRACVNPAHLEPVTNATNVLRGYSPAAKNARKTHCLRGHELSGSNLYQHGHRRHCKACRAITQKSFVTGCGKRISYLYCKYGHPLFGANLFIASGKRGCRECGKRHRLNYLERIKRTALVDIMTPL